MKIKFSALFLIAVSSACSPILNDGQIDRHTGLVWRTGRWERIWWSDQFDVAKSKGCHLEDSCGLFPPYYLGAEYCGEPQTICPGEHWKAGQK